MDMSCKIICFLTGIFAALSLTAAPCIWLKQPNQTNFNATHNWSTASSGRAAALIPNRPLPDNPFFEYRFECRTPGTYRIWGRTFDPKWSSAGRWRIDEGAWRPWQPGERVDREVFQKTFPLDWCPWGEAELGAGSHTIRFEATGKRPQGDYHYFVQDALLLSADPAFRPAGKFSPAESAAALLRQMEKSAALSHDPLPEEAAALAREAAHDLTALAKLRQLVSKLEKTATATTPDDGTKPLLSLRVENLRLEDKILRFTMISNRPFAGKLLAAFLRDEVLYAVVPFETDGTGRSAEITLRVPEGLPPGKLKLHAFPLEIPFGYGEPAPFTLPAAEGAVNQPLSWGLYRSRTGVRHFWYVTPENVLIWNGEPYLPFGGMINTRLSWAAKPGDPENNGFLNGGREMLRGRIAQLKSYGIRDVYFNGFFPRSNPDTLREIVTLVEDEKMNYGLHLSNTPEGGDPGFIRQIGREIELEPGIRSHKLDLANDFLPGTRPKKVVPLPVPCRVIYAILDVAGTACEAGISHFGADGTVTVVFNAPTQPGDRLIYLPEAPLPSGDPAGYLGSLDEYLRKVEMVYGTLPLGDHLRFFIDPLNNEMHARPNSVPSSEAFRNRRAAFLARRYGSPAELNRLCRAVDGGVPDFHTAARLVPVAGNNLTSCWIDPETGRVYRFADENNQTLRDLKELRGEVCREVINRVIAVLKKIADVPVLLKHNTWFSDWFVNPCEKGGSDGTGMESYCYGDSLAYHNSAVVYAEAMQSRRTQWCPVTESSAAAFEGQKNYCGYLDRLQMMDDIDQLMMLGAKGFYHFGMMFDPDNGRFFTTEITRDPRQLEWLATHAKLYRSAGEKLLSYRPSYHGWYPGYLREGEAVGRTARRYDIDGNYMATSAQIRMAPDGRWILPAINPDAPFRTILAAEPLMTARQREEMSTRKALRLTGDMLDAFTAHAVGVIAPEPGNPDQLQEFRRRVLGYETFQTDALNGVRLPGGRLLVWVCVEREFADVVLPSGAEATNLKGETLAIENGRLHLKREPYVLSRENLPSHIPNGYFNPDNGQPEAAYLTGVTMKELQSLNAPAFHRWLPERLEPADVRIFREAEAFRTTTFPQPSLVGYSRYSGGRAIGINSHWPAPAGKDYEATYDFELEQPLRQADFHLRKQISPSMDLEVLIDGTCIGRIAADAPASDRLHLSPWNAGLGKNNLEVGYVTLPLGELAAGKHTLTLRALGRSPGYRLDTTLMGGDAEKNTGVIDDREAGGMRALQLDSWLITGK